jgi:hypothetical protein
VGKNLHPDQAAVGFRVKSGWATAVLLAGTVAAPRVLDRRTVDLSDPAVPGSRQPYHAGTGLLEEDEATLSRRLRVVQRVTAESVTGLVEAYRERSRTPRAAGLVVGSLIEPGSIANTHIRAHALEGRLFRTALAEALRSHGLPCTVEVERNVYARAAAVLGLAEDELKREVAGLGRAVSGPWRADEKLATLVAWMALAGIEKA